ncbi:radical SAM protein [Patescibacteria group bacterium]|nr:MAG: radical SAM protein [Patescibacteria group bacterium]
MKKFICRLPIDCVLAVTYNCNARCVMCDIWKIKNFSELAPEQFLKLPASLRDVNISGGEPFLRRDLPQIIHNVKKACPAARLVISTNGFATGLILAQMRKIFEIKPNIGIAISIDGIGEKHDEMRGIRGGFNMAMKTLEGLKRMGMKNLRLGFTVTERNINELGRVYNLARKEGVEFTNSFAQSSDIYFGGKQNTDFKDMDSGSGAGMTKEVLRAQYRHLIRAELSGWNIKRWARAYYAHGMYNFITGKQAELSSAPGRDFFFLDPSGEIYPSVVHNFRMGNIRAVQGFEQFWCSSASEGVREKIDAAKLPVWMICTARTAIKKHPFKVGWWVLKNKFSVR